LVGDICRRTTSRARECVCTGSARKTRVSARWWCVQANHRRRSHGDGTTPTTCARQGTTTGGRRACKCARRGSVLTRLLVKERQGLGSTARAQRVGAGGKPKLGDARRTKERPPLQGKGARAAMTAAAPASNRLGSMAGSQATAGLRGGAVRDSGQHTSSKLTWLGPASARRPGPQQGEGG
jgi:hypothetical protein